MGSEIAAQNDKINEIAAKHGFPNGYDLVGNAAGALEVLQQISDFESSLAEVRQNQQKLQRIGSSAIRLLRELSAGHVPADPEAAQDPEFAGGADKDDVDLIIAAILNRQYSGVLPQTATLVRELRDAAYSALTQLSDGQPGRPAEPRLKSAVLQLHSVYREFHPDSRGITYNAADDEPYSGRFYFLVRDLCGLIGVKRSPEAIGKQIELALKSSGGH